MPSLPDDVDGLPQTTASGIYYEVEALTYNEQWVDGANQMGFTCRVPWEQAFDFVTDMVGKGVRTGTNILSRTIPERNPFVPTQFCTQCVLIPSNTEGIQTADEVTGYPVNDYVRYRCLFETLPYHVLTDDECLEIDPPSDEHEILRYVSRKRRAYSKEQQIPGGTYKTVSTPSVELYQVAFKIVPFADISYTWHRLPIESIPLATIASMTGKINSEAFDTFTDYDGYDLPARTVLFYGFDDTNRYYDSNGDRVVDLILTFKYAAQEWNKFITPGGAFVEVSSDGTGSGTKPYSEADLRTLFQPA